MSKYVLDPLFLKLSMHTDGSFVCFFNNACHLCITLCIPKGPFLAFLSLKPLFCTVIMFYIL